MGRPAAGYRLADGTRVPGVTTITSCWNPSIEGLLVWANRLGLDGKDHREARDEAASVGTLCHDMVEAHAHGITVDEIRAKWKELHPDLFPAADQGFQAYLEWCAQTKLEVVATEMPLVSEVYRFGGTPDAIAWCSGKLALCDWKTSGSIRSPMLLQLSAYRELWHENNPSDRLESFYILRFGKEHGDFHMHGYPSSVIDVAWDAFKALRQVYEWDKVLKKVVG